MTRPANNRAVKYLPLLAIIFLAGCETPVAELTDTRYTRLVVTDFEGDVMAEWIAEGFVKADEQGYSIRAVERTSGGAYPQTTKYPNGWETTVTGPNITKQRVDKPAWIAELDGEVAATPAADSPER